MQIDRYTKSVLTVIAVSLVWLSVKDNVIKPALAHDIMKVEIVGSKLQSGLWHNGAYAIRVCTEC